MLRTSIALTLSVVVITEVVPRLSEDARGHFLTGVFPYTQCALQALAHDWGQCRRGQARHYQVPASYCLPEFF